MNIRKLFVMGFLITGSMTNVHAAEVQGDNWSRFRGPNGSGISHAKTVPQNWTKDDYNWVLNLPGRGHGSPVVVGNKLYVVSGKRKTADRIVVCVDTKKKEFLWQRTFSSAKHRLHPANNYGSSTPVADAQGVIVTWASPDRLILKAINSDGKTKWTRDLGPYQAINGAGTSPIIVEDLVIVTNIQMDPEVFIRAGVLPKDYKFKPKKSYVVAVDRQTGKTRWQLERKTFLAGYATPCMRRLKNGQQELIFLDSFYGLTGVNPRNGKVNWQTKRLLSSRTVASPVIAGDLILGSHGRGVSAEILYAVRPGNRDTKPRVEFEIRKGPPLVPTPIAKDGLAFLWADNGVVSCIQIKNGQQVWRKRVGGNYYASPVWVNGRLYCVDRGGMVAVIAAAKKYKLIAKVSLGERSFATPAVANGVMYFRTETKLMSLGGKK